MNKHLSSAIVTAFLIGTPQAYSQSALDRFVSSENKQTRIRGLYRSNLRQMALVLEELEGKLGVYEVLNKWIESIVAPVSEISAQVTERLRKLPRDKAFETVNLIQKTAQASGNIAGVRSLREIRTDARFKDDPTEQLIEIYQSLRVDDLRTQLERFIADNGGSISKVIRTYVRSSRFGDDVIKLTEVFGLTRNLFDWVEGEIDFPGGPWAILAVAGGIIALPFTGAFDLVLLPFIAGYHLFSWIGDQFKTTPAEQRLYDERKEWDEERKELKKKERNQENAIQRLEQKLDEIQRELTRLNTEKRLRESGEYK